MNTKTCITCEEVKPQDDFYKHPKMADGYLGRCKVCHKAGMKENRRVNPEVQARDCERSKTPERRAHIQRVAERHRYQHPEAYKARTAVNNAVRDGRLMKPLACQECGSTFALHGHHDDYAAPLVVRWLCAMCHHRMHAAERLQGAQRIQSGDSHHDPS